MKVRDTEIENLDINSAENLVKCVNLLCDQESDEEDLALITKWMDEAKTKKLYCEQFNELLLMLNHLRISTGFFEYFFNIEGDINSLDLIKEGISKFRSYAILCYGNFRYAYRNWIEMSFLEISTDVKQHCCLMEDMAEIIKTRSMKILDIELIPKEKLSLLGYISEKEVTQDIKSTLAIYYKIYKDDYDWGKFSEQELIDIRKMSEYYDSSHIEKWRSKIESIMDELNTKQEDIVRTHDIGRQNLDIYLTWDYMDVYIATSMREQWEYEDTFDFIQYVFHEQEIENYHLRFFDPTQSWIKDRIQKGLVEGLMLKRAKFTIYQAQESDTFGKDSELAITLAQGKPVIAYVPEIDIDEHAKKIAECPLKYFRKRISILETDDIFLECKIEIEKTLGMGTYDKIKAFRELLGAYFSDRTFNMNLDEETEFKSSNSSILSTMCKALAIAEKSYFNKRADTLQNIHPLGLQISLLSGVANGVLVARTKEQCIDLIKKIIEGEMEFTLTKNDYGYCLSEEITKSNYRVITNNKKLTNSFWNFYF